ncbi:MAG: carbohydrate-binding protein [Lachnospiraceae bacterium]|nr:carbohydrate-binding protein [Lachnospiraceae bacterium]
MSEVSIAVRDMMGSAKAEATGSRQAVLVFEQEYQPGDTINISVSDINKHYVIRIDDTMDEALVYLTKPYILYVIPFEEKRISYNPKSFTGNRHYLTIREAEDFEIKGYRNLAKNVMDQHGDPGCYPHVFANVETRGEAVFAARNAIDGVIANASHGAWPYESWGINMQDDAEVTLAFGRPVDFDRIVLYTRADFPHDNWWVKATFTFSDGTTEVVEMEKSDKAHVFQIERKNITWMKLGSLIKADDPSPFPALSQIAVFGTESGQ